jgi:hypothetical protein
MALMVKHKEEKNYVQVPNHTAQLPERKNGGILSLQALGLIVNLWSYDVEQFVVHKTELYKRYARNKESSVKTCWAELVAAKYILEYKVRVGGRNDYVYIYNIHPFSAETIAAYNQEVLDTYGDYTTLDFQDLKNKSSKTGPQKQEILKEKEKKDLIKKDLIKEKTLVPSLEDINSAMLFFKTIFPNAPIKEIAEKLVEDATDEENPKPPIVAHPNQFRAMLGFRLNDWERSKRTETAQFEAKPPVRTEHTPEWFQEASEYYSEPQEDDSVKKALIVIKLKKMRGEELEEEEEILWSICNQK